MASLLLQPPHSFCCCSSATAAAASTNSRRPAVILPGLGNNTGDYGKLQRDLQQDYNVPSVVAKVSRLDWFRNAAGLLDSNYWRGTLRPRPVLDWYLERVDDAVQEAKEFALDGTLSLIGHSAGGWLARVYMEEFGVSNIKLLLTLGTPHLPPPKGVPGVIDQTRGLLYYVEKNCTKAVYNPELKYVCVAGRLRIYVEPAFLPNHHSPEYDEGYIQGARLLGKSDVKIVSVDGDQLISEVAVMDNPTSSPPTWRARFVGQGYKQVCGEADVWGDGVVPEVSAHLEGALNLSLQGVYHSPVGSDDTLRPWYGSPAVLDKWAPYLLE